MIPLVDMHVHLFAGLDDGPQTEKDALAMCRMAYEDGTHFASATAHMNDMWPEVTPDRVRSACEILVGNLRNAQLPLTVFPTAEVAAFPDVEEAWNSGKLLGYAGGQDYMLLEMPMVFVDLRHTVDRLLKSGVRPVLAHVDRYSEFVHHQDSLEELIQMGCLAQLNADAITHPFNKSDERGVRRLIKSGLIHLLGSDGHSTDGRPPLMSDAYRQLVSWVGQVRADRIASHNGLAILQGLPLPAASAYQKKRTWFFGLLESRY